MMGHQPLKGQKAPVTGANSGIGEGVDEADYVHGPTIFVDGGMTLYPEFARGG